MNVRGRPLVCGLGGVEAEAPRLPGDQHQRQQVGVVVPIRPQGPVEEKAVLQVHAGLAQRPRPGQGRLAVAVQVVGYGPGDFFLSRALPMSPSVWSTMIWAQILG